MKYDVAIIGGGVIGSAIAWKLAHFNLNILLLEGNPDIASATTKANGGVIHTGYDPKPGSLMAKLCVEGARSYPILAKKLGFGFFQTQGLLVGTEEADQAVIQKKLDYGRNNGVQDLHVLRTLEEIQHVEPRATKAARIALHIPRTAVVDPFEVAVAFAENAVVNGVTVLRNTRIQSVSRKKEGFCLVSQTGAAYESSYIVNAAGVYADMVAGFIGDTSFHVDARLGEILVFDKEGDQAVKTVLFPMPRQFSKGIIVIPTVSGNTLISATARMTENKQDLSNTQEGIEELLSSALHLVPDMNRNLMIRQFVGLRAVLREKDDFLIEPSPVDGRFINVAGIKSPGLASAPAIADMVAALLEKGGLPLEENREHVDERVEKQAFRSLSIEEKEKLIKENPNYGRVICRCETITQAEILEAIRRPAGARTVDGVKRRTRAGMGRCQGGFCQPRVLEILSEELGLAPWEILQEDENSYIIYDRLKGGKEK